MSAHPVRVCRSRHMQERGGWCPECGARDGETPEVHERIREIIVWARNRIEQCRREEDKFSRLPHPWEPPRKGLPSVVLEAATERRAMQAVLRMLGLDDSHGSG